MFFVADVRVEGPFQTEPAVNLGARGFVLMMPVRSTGMERLIGIVPDELSEKPELSFEDVRASSEQLLHLQVAQVNWFSKYHVHHRVAERFTVDRCSIAGDAAHIHSPAGGQGMNTGIGDAANLAWKLADVIGGRIDARALATYEAERIAFARVLVKTTDTLFQGMAGRGLGSELVRALVVPTLMPLTEYFPSVRRQLFKSISQIRIKYRQSALSVGQAGKIHGGDRLPWVPSSQADNFAPLQSLDWQVHVYGDAKEPLVQAAAELGLTVQVFPWTSAADGAGLKRDAMYLVRPDGHVALASAEQNPQVLREYVERWALKLDGAHAAV
jgi:hypothetical protein